MTEEITLHDIIQASLVSSLERHFKLHPRKTAILKALRQNQLSFGEIDQVFREAEYYTCLFFFTSKKFFEENTYITFQIRYKT